MSAPVRIRAYVAADEDAVIAVWEACGLTRPWNDPRRDIWRKLARDAEGFLVAGLDGVVVGTVMIGYEGHRGGINYLGVHSDHQGSGIGRALMAAAEVRLRGLGCPKINLQVRTSNLAVLEFYARLGYVADEVVSVGKRLEHDPERQRRDPT